MSNTGSGGNLETRFNDDHGTITAAAASVTTT